MIFHEFSMIFHEFWGDSMIFRFSHEFSQGVSASPSASSPGASPGASSAAKSVVLTLQEAEEQDVPDWRRSHVFWGRNGGFMGIYGDLMLGYLVGGLEHGFYFGFPSYWEFHNPN
jgi:hypothetical protein